MTKLVHYSRKPMGPLVSKAQGQGRPTGIGKPHGLWVSVEGDDSFGWKEWCESEQWGLDRFTIGYEVVLKPEANILRLETPLALDVFTDEFGVYDEIGTIMRSKSIVWDRVADTYQGIIIAPYQWSRRLDHDVFWYYGWDCASGCIWDADAVQSVTEIKQPERMFRDDEDANVQSNTVLQAGG